MKLTYEQIMSIRAAINQLSEINPDTKYPLYDMGAKYNMFLGTFCAKVKGHIRKINELRENIGQRVGPELVKLNEADLRNPGRVKSAMELAADKEWEEFLNSTVDVDIQPFNRKLIQPKGATPTPNVLEALDPLLVD